ncbi:AP2 domain-containing protein [Bacillus cereus]|nr:AP2 domain-containing protein [Bacillus cereus]
MAKEIPLQNDMLVIVDDEDYERCMEHTWVARVSKKSTLVVQSTKSILLTKFILGIEDTSKRVRFKNNNRLDYRKNNLVSVNVKKSNAFNKGHKNSSSKYKGVSWYKSRKKWCAEITFDKKRKRLGYFDSEDAAALAYNKAALELIGNEAYLNVIGSDNSSEHMDIKKCVQYRKRKKIGFKGVYKSGLKYAVSLWNDGKYIYLGLFETQEEAAKAYDKKAIELFGDKAILNFPEGR